jgi:hypothetical protein
VIVHGDSSAELEACDALDVPENAEAEVPFGMRDRHDGRVEMVLEVVMVTFDANESPAGGLELADYVARTLHAVESTT